jgi:hypothetical protein
LKALVFQGFFYSSPDLPQKICHNG